MEKGAAILNVLLRVVSTRSCHLSKDLKEASVSFGNVVGGGGFQAEGAASEKAPGHSVLKEQPEAWGAGAANEIREVTGGRGGTDDVGSKAIVSILTLMKRGRSQCRVESRAEHNLTSVFKGSR